MLEARDIFGILFMISWTAWAFGFSWIPLLLSFILFLALCINLPSKVEKGRKNV